MIQSGGEARVACKQGQMHIRLFLRTYFQTRQTTITLVSYTCHKTWFILEIISYTQTYKNPF
jgi:hypothetical protein